MPTAKFSDYQQQVDEFNQKYGVNFSFKNFRGDVLKRRNMRKHLGSGAKHRESAADAIYKTAYESLYKEAAHSYVDKKIDAFHYETLLNDFEKLMSHYATVCKENKNSELIPSARGGWTKSSDVVKAAERMLEGVNEDAITDVRARYESRKLRIRDMRKYAASLRTTHDDSPERVAGLLIYADALEAANNARVGSARFFNYFRGKAEMKCAEELRSLARALLGDKYSEAVSIAKQPAKMNLANDLDTSLKDALASEEVKKDLKKEQSKIKSSQNPAPAKADIPQSTVDNTNIKEPIKIDDTQESKNASDLDEASLKGLNTVDRHKKLAASTQFKDRMMKEVMTHLKASKSTDKQKLEDAGKAIYEELMEYALDSVCDLYDESDANNDNEEFIHSTFKTNAVAMYEMAYLALDGLEIPVEKKPVVAQKLANQFLVRATPVGFYAKVYGRYANNYAINNSSITEDLFAKDTECKDSPTFYGKMIEEAKNELESRQKVDLTMKEVSNDSEELSEPHIDQVVLKNFALDK